MPHFEAHSQVILKQEDVPEGFTLKEIHEAMVNKQFPIRFKKGAVSYEIGMLISSVLGRDSIVGNIGLDPELTLIFEKDEELNTVVKHLEWTT